MVTIKEHIKYWDENYDWRERGDEWSAPWGGVDMQWYFTILPRIHSFVPTGTILEIAPGFGRWSQFLVHLCKNLILVDSSEKCIEACKERFKSFSNITYHVNNGKSLEMIPDASIDFVFSFDSLVHAEDEVIEAYLNQLIKKLKKGSAGFMHHSNIGEYKTFFSFVKRIPSRIRVILIVLGLIDFLDHGRAYSMTAEKFRQYAKKAGFQCVKQEIINWKTRRLIDCLSVFKRKNVHLEYSPLIIRNKGFMNNVRYIYTLSALYKAELANTK